MRRNNLDYNYVWPFWHNIRVHWKERQTDRQTVRQRDRETDGIVIPLLRYAQLCKFVCERAIKSVAASITFGVIHFWLSKQYL